MAATQPVRRVNFQNIGKPIDPGEYTVRLESHKWQEDKNGNDRVSMIFVIEDDEQYQGKKLFSSYSPDGDAAYYLMDAMVQLGVDPDELMNNEVDPDSDEEGVNIDQLLKQAVGAKARVVVSHTQGFDKSGNERIYANITSIKAI